MVVFEAEFEAALEVEVDAADDLFCPALDGRVAVA